MSQQPIKDNSSEQTDIADESYMDEDAYSYQDSEVDFEYDEVDNDDDYDEGDARAEGQEDEDLVKLVAQNTARWKAYHEKFKTEEKDQNQQTMSYDMKQASKLQLFNEEISFDMLVNELNGIICKQCMDLVVDSVGDDVHHWTVDIAGFEPDSALQTDLDQLGRKYYYSAIQLSVKFTRGLYPSLPPSVEIIRPRLKGPMLGALCSHPMLQLKYWDPFTSLFSVFIKIKQYLQEYARVDLDWSRNDPNMEGGAYYQMERLMARLEALDTIQPMTDPVWQHVYDNRKVDVDQSRLMAQKSVAKPTSSNNAQQAQQQFNMLLDNFSDDDEDALGFDDKQLVTTATGSQTQQQLQQQQQYQQQLRQAQLKKVVWASGTGYGTYNTQYEKVWNSKESQEIQLAQDESIRRVLALVSRCIILETNWSITEEWKQVLNINMREDNNQPFDSESSAFMMSTESPEAFVDSIKCSGLVGCLAWHLQGKNILEISERKELYLEVVKVLAELCRHQFVPLFRMEVVKAVEKLNIQGQNYLRMAQKGDGPESSQQDQEQYIVSYIFQLLNHTQDWCKKNVDLSQVQPVEVDEQENDGDYIKLLSPYKVSQKRIAETHLFGKESPVSSKKRSTRLAKEFAGLDNNLPINPSSSIFVCSDEERFDLWRVLIIGPEDTPYSCGCFIFDIGFPNLYPEYPPKVLIKTTGQGQVRFNPNLYNNGKVCLSLLGTWSGRQGEAWDANSSSVLQVVISIQSLILVPDPYYNEPGYEVSSSRYEGASINYTKNIRIQTMRFAILDMLLNPPPEFQEVVKLHFKLRKDYLLQTCKKWVEEETQVGKQKQIQDLYKQIQEAVQKL